VQSLASRAGIGLGNAAVLLYPSPLLGSLLPAIVNANRDSFRWRLSEYYLLFSHHLGLVSLRQEMFTIRSVVANLDLTKRAFD
jgi:hypothetical protein